MSQRCSTTIKIARCPCRWAVQRHPNCQDEQGALALPERIDDFPGVLGGDFALHARLQVAGGEADGLALSLNQDIGEHRQGVLWVDEALDDAVNLMEIVEKIADTRNMRRDVILGTGEWLPFNDVQQQYCGV